LINYILPEKLQQYNLASDGFIFNVFFPYTPFIVEFLITLFIERFNPGIS